MLIARHGFLLKIDNSGSDQLIVHHFCPAKVLDEKISVIVVDDIGLFRDPAL